MAGIFFNRAFLYSLFSVVGAFTKKEKDVMSNHESPVLKLDQSLLP